MGTITTLFLIGSSANLQETGTGVETRTSSNPGNIRLYDSAFNFDRIFFGLAGNEDRYKISG